MKIEVPLEVPSGPDFLFLDFCDDLLSRAPFVAKPSSPVLYAVIRNCCFYVFFSIFLVIY